MDLYYTRVGNIAKSKAQQAADAARVVQSEQDEEAAELAREARFDKAAHAPPTPPDPQDILDAAFKAFDKADTDLAAALHADPERALDTTKQAYLDVVAASAAVDKAYLDSLKK